MFRRFAINCALFVLVLPMAARTRPHYGGTLRVETAGDPWQQPDGIARRLVYDGLTRIGSDASVQPALATGWETDSGDHRWQFRLRPGVHFHDGTPLTSTAVVASLNVICNGACPWSAAHAVGSSVVFTSDSPMPNLPALLASDKFLIALTIGAGGNAPSGNVGTGPYQVGASNNGGVTLNANESCWQGRPFADTIEIRAHRAAHDQWLDLGLGRADVVEVPVELIRQAKQQKLAVVASSSVDLLALQITQTGPGSNPSLRAAIAASIDRNAIANVIFQKQGEATASSLPQSLSGFSFLFPVDRDLNKAHALRGGLTVPTMTVAAESDGVLLLAAQRIALDLNDASFNVVVATPAIGQRADLTLRKCPLEGGTPSAVLDGVLLETGETPIGADANPAALFKAERTFLEQHTLIPLVDLPRAFAMGPRARDLHLDVSGVPDLADVSLEDAP